MTPDGPGSFRRLARNVSHFGEIDKKNKKKWELVLGYSQHLILRTFWS